MTLKPISKNQSFRLPVIVLGMIWILVSSGWVLAASLPPLRDPDRIRYKPLSFEPPRVERVLLDNGLRLYILPDKELPLVQIKAVVQTGSIYDPSGQEGLAELTAVTMRTGGVLGMTGDAVDETLEFMAATFHVSQNRDSGIFSFSVMKKDLDRGFDIFSRTLMQPSFAENKLILGKDLKSEELRRIFDDPQKLAFREFGRLIHGESPRGRLVTQESIRTIRRDDLIRFHKHFFHPKNIIISITGDIESREMTILVDRHFGSWTSPEGKPEPPPPPQLPEGNIFFLTKDLPQSIVVIGWLAPAKRDPHFYPFEVLDFMVGSGGFRSRIFQEIRTNLGLAYSTGSFYSAKSDYGLFGAYALTKSESTVKVISRIRGILQEMGEKPVPSEELDRAKMAILNRFIFSFTSAEQIAFQRLMIEHEGLPDDFLVTYRPKIGKVSAEDIQNAALRNLAPNRAILLIVGNDKTYKDILRHFGRVTRIEATF
jgi:predicted Zn-dependent peptidase